MSGRPRDATPITLSVGVYRLLLRGYPEAFRRAYGPDMLQVFRDSCLRTYGQSGSMGMISLWAAVSLDLITSAIREHLEAEIRMSSHGFVRWTGVALLVGGISAALLVLLHYLIRPEGTIHFALLVSWYFATLIGLIGMSWFLTLDQRKWISALIVLGMIMVVFGIFLPSDTRVASYPFVLSWSFLGVGAYLGSRFPRWVSVLWVAASILGLLGIFLPQVMDTPAGPGGPMFASFGLASAGAGVAMWKQAGALKRPAPASD